MLVVPARHTHAVAPPESPPLPLRVWYLAYGSNMNEARFMRYITGDATTPGCRDMTPPRTSRWLHADVELHFAGTSTRWGAGVAFVNRSASESAKVRAWDITFEQFEDVFAQENRLAIPHQLSAEACDQADSTVGSGWYCRILRFPEFDTENHPAMTFTWDEQLRPNPPSVTYLETIRSGLLENPGASAREIDTYLSQRTGPAKHTG